MSEVGVPTGAAEWATTSGDIWADRWRDTDAALEGLSPFLLSAVVTAVRHGAVRAFDIGCGPGSTTLAVAEALPESTIVACDISPSLGAIARERTASKQTITVMIGDAPAVVASEGSFDLFFSRHGVMFFSDPVQAFRAFRRAATSDAALVFSCFRNWDSNPWAKELATAAAGAEIPSPGREPSGFAFAEPHYVHEILDASGWSEVRSEAVDFSYVAGEGEDAIDQAFSFLSDLGPASRIVQSLPEDDRTAALDRMRGVIEGHFVGSAVIFPAAAWIWSAKAGAT
jgi:SAM-dependent methyltransferase